MDTWVLRLRGLLFLLLFPMLAGSELKVFTAPSFQALLGSRAMLPCRFDTGGPVALGSLQVTWYRWEDRIEWFDKGQAELGGRLLDTDLQSGNASLLLAKVAVSDEGLYKCNVHYGAQQQQGNTTLHVHASPTISIQKQQAVGSTETSLLCDVGGFYPRDVDATWLRDGRVLDSFTRSSPKRNLDGTFSLTLTYTFTPAKSDTGRVFSCRVRHITLEQPLQAELALDVPAAGSDRTSAVIGAVVGIVITLGAAGAAFYCWWQRRGWASMSKVEGPERCRLGQEVTLRCSMEGKIPADTAVMWERTQGEDRAVIQEDGPGVAPERQPLLLALPPGWTPTEERSETCLVAFLTFTPTLQDHGARVRCHFQHEALDSSKEPEWWEIRAWAPLELSGIQVLPRWDPPGEVPFGIDLQNFFPWEIHRVEWSVDGKAWERSEPSEWRENEDGSFSARSVWRVPGCRLTSAEQRVRVSVQHGPGDPPIEGALSLADTGLLRPPEMSEISQPQAVTAGREVALSCRVAGHFPGELGVTWLRKGRGEARAAPLQDSAEYRLLSGRPVLAADGKSFQQEAWLLFTASVHRDQGAEYICRVEHAALQTPAERRSAELQVTAPPEVCGIQVLPHWDPPEEVPFVVQIHNFHPKEMHRIAWGWDGDGSGTADTPEPTQNPDGTFSARSVWRVPSRSLARPEQRVRVSVQHGPGDPLMQRELSLRDTGLLQSPAVSQIFWPQSVTAGSEIPLSCHIAGHFPGELKVTWLQKQKGVHDPVPVQDSPKCRLIPGRAVPAGDGKSFQQDASLVLTAVEEKDLEAEFICRVEHVTLQTPIERHSRALRERVPDTERLQQAHSHLSPSPPELSRIQVLPCWDPPEKVPFAVHLQNFFPREIHRIEWSVDGKDWERSEPSDFRNNKDGTFTARSVWRVPGCRLTSAEQRVRVSVQHGPGDPPIEGELSLADTGLLRPPDVLEISQPQAVTAGREVALSCRVAGHFPGELGVTWLRKGRGEARAAPLQDSAEYRLLPGRPVPAADGKSFQQEVRLHFTPSVCRDQGAEYICRVEHAALQTPADRCSTELLVTAAPELSGIQVLPRWDPPGEVPFAVDLQNFLPREIHRVEWSVDGRAWERSEPSDRRENEDGSFSARSVWRVPGCRLTSAEQRVRVSVQHGPGDPPIEGALSLAHTSLLRPPEMSEISQPQAVMLGREVALSCRVAGHFPGELGVTWLQKQKGVHGPVPVQDSRKRRLIPGRAVPAEDGKSFQQDASLVLTAVEEKDLGAEFICHVEHVTLQTPIERHSRALRESVPGTEQLQQAHSRLSPSLPKVSRIQVLPHWDPPEKVPFAIHLQNFFPREIHRIEWSVDGKDWEQSEPRDFRNNKDGTFTARSVWKVPGCRLTSAEQRVRVSVQHGPGDPPIEEELSLAHTGLLRRPDMSEVCQPQAVTAGREVALRCHVAGHFPGELGVTWLRKGRGEARAAPLQDSAEYRLLPGRPVPAADGKSFQQEVRLLFTPSVHRDQGAEYICRVEHVALQTPTERRSTELQVTAAPELSGIQVLPRWDPPGEVPFAVDLQNFLPREIHCIEWSVDGKAWERSEPSEWRENEDGSFSAGSVWRVPGCRLTSAEQRVRVSVQHGPRDPPIEGELSLAHTGLLRPPEMLEISQPQAVSLGREVALSCRVAGHFPGELEVTWLRKGRGEALVVPLQDSDEYRFIPGRPVLAADGKSFQQEPRLVLTAMEKGDLEAEFICRVKHIALQTPIEQRSGELQVTGHQDAPVSQDPESKEGKPDEGAPGDVSGSHDGTEGGPSLQEQGARAPSSEEDHPPYIRTELVPPGP